MKPQLVGKGFDGHPEHINKKGRPKALPNLNDLLIETLTKEELLAILKEMRVRAKKGGVKETELLLDRAYGKAKNTDEYSGEITIRVVYDNKNSNSQATESTR